MNKITFDTELVEDTSYVSTMRLHEMPFVVVDTEGNVVNSSSIGKLLKDNNYSRLPKSVAKEFNRN